VSYVQVTGRITYSRDYDNNIVAEHNVEIHDTSLPFYGYTHFRQSRELYIAVTWKWNPMP